jgi:hypothetical protein
MTWGPLNLGLCIRYSINPLIDARVCGRASLSPLSFYCGVILTIGDICKKVLVSEALATKLGSFTKHDPNLYMSKMVDLSQIHT